jgi:ribosomal protein L11 methyltransferase
VNWVEISVRADGEAAEAVSELFNRFNSRPDGQGGAVTEVGGFDPVGDDHHPFVTIRTYLPADDPESAARQEQIEQGLWFLGRIYPLGEPQVRPLAEEDWANTWKASYHPIRIGHFLIIPEWERETTVPQPDEHPIILDPGMAFGTGLHPSTQLCLLAIESVIRPGQRVLDAGCGSGILSIAAARLGATQIDAFDIDPIAVRATLENAGLNDLPIPINPFESAGPAADDPFWQANERRYDVILVNILPHIIQALLDRGLHDHLAADGRMILAGIIEEREPDLVAYLAERGLNVERRLGQGDWVCLVVARP